MDWAKHGGLDAARKQQGSPGQIGSRNQGRVESRSCMLRHVRSPRRLAIAVRRLVKGNGQLSRNVVRSLPRLKTLESTFIGG
jgi:hypothetical protein